MMYRNAEKELQSNRPVVVFVHGNSLGKWTYQAQLEDPRFHSRQLLAIDLPGNGDAPRRMHPRDYKIDQLGDWLIQRLDRLNASQIVLVGHSYGGHLILQKMATIDNLSGVLVFGTPPLSSPTDAADAFLPSGALASATTGTLSPEEAEAFGRLLTDGDRLTSAIAESVLSADPAFREGAALSLTEGPFENEVQALQSAKCPVLIALGENDPAVNLHYLNTLPLQLLWENRIHVIAGSGHCPQMERPNEFNILLERFLDDVLTA